MCFSFLTFKVLNDSKHTSGLWKLLDLLPQLWPDFKSGESFTADWQLHKKEFHKRSIWGQRGVKVASPPSWKCQMILSKAPYWIQLGDFSALFLCREENIHTIPSYNGGLFYYTNPLCSLFWYHWHIMCVPAGFKKICCCISSILNRKEYFII